ncbi:hypothetical protein [Croceicoccus bisphenolivorans]|nr:hypothetical protein [Croceicoccus bisphenolivorans]
MTFSPGFLEVLIYGSLVWCAVSGIGLAVMLLRDGKSGEIW